MLCSQYLLTLIWVHISLIYFQIIKDGVETRAVTGEPRGLHTPNGCKSKSPNKFANLSIHLSNLEMIYSYGKVGPALRDVAVSHQEEVAAAGEVTFSFYMHMTNQIF